MIGTPIPRHDKPKVLKQRYLIWYLEACQQQNLCHAAEKIEHKLPPQYSQYARVFDKPKAGKLPPQQSFDHAVDLKDAFDPKVSKAYPLNPKEMNTWKEFIDKHLKSGKIWKSQSPQASPFFFIQKKDGGLGPF